MEKSNDLVMKLKTTLARVGSPMTRADLASALGVTKPTVARTIETAKKAGYKIKKSKIRQGERGPEAQAYTLV